MVWMLFRANSVASTVQMPNLRIVSRHGVGCDNLPVNELAARGVHVAHDTVWRFVKRAGQTVKKRP